MLIRQIWLQHTSHGVHRMTYQSDYEKFRIIFLAMNKSKHMSIFYMYAQACMSCCGLVRRAGRRQDDGRHADERAREAVGEVLGLTSPDPDLVMLYCCSWNCFMTRTLFRLATCRRNIGFRVWNAEASLFLRLLGEDC